MGNPCPQAIALGKKQKLIVISFLRDDAGTETADVRVGGLGDGQDGAGAL